MQARRGILGLLTALVGALSVGCATYGDQLGEAMSLADAGDYEAARQTLATVLDPDGDDRLLFHLEKGALAHLQGDYQASIRLLSQAEQIGEDLYTRYFRDGLRSALTHPRNAPYRGTAYELAYIHYYQALNFTALAQQSEDRIQRREWLDAALVEVRKLDARLFELSRLEGEYEESNNGQQRSMSFLLRAFHGFSAELADRDSLRFREAAWLRYLSGLLYEMAGDLDDARIAYHRAAELYEIGYAEQFDLDQGMVDQAWEDAWRLSWLTGLWDEVEQAALNRFGEEGVARIMASGIDDAQVVILQQVGRLPARGELNLMMYADGFRRSVTLRPVHTGTHEEQIAQNLWFRTLYADTGPLALLAHYRQGGFDGLVLGHFEKSFYLGGLWSDLDGLGVLDPMRGGVRVTVPYPGPPPRPASVSRLTVNGQSHRLHTADDIARMSHQDLLLNAGEELRRAAAREVLRHTIAAAAARELEEQGGLAGALLGAAARIGTSASARADTRAWQTLPAEVRVLRLRLPPGEHELRLERGEWLGPESGRERTLALAPGEIRLLRTRRVD